MVQFLVWWPLGFRFYVLGFKLMYAIDFIGLKTTDTIVCVHSPSFKIDPDPSPKT
jgi:hypothetical protein